MRLHAFKQIAAVLAACAALAGPVQADAVTVFAAASLKNALEEAASRYEAGSGQDVHLSFAASSALARQIQAGAPADIFISAHPGWMDVLDADGLVSAGSRLDLLSNRLVLIAHGEGRQPEALFQGFDLVSLLGDGRLAMALADAVPAGIYAKAALQWLGQWEALAPMTAQAGNVRIALALVARGDAPYGIVYASDTVAEEGVSVIGTFPPDSHPAVIYPAAALNDRDTSVAFMAFLASADARAAFEAQGFTLLTGPE